MGSKTCLQLPKCPDVDKVDRANVEVGKCTTSIALKVTLKVSHHIHSSHMQVLNVVACAFIPSWFFINHSHI